MSALHHQICTLASRRAAEERWCARVRAAKLRFDLAVADAARALRQTDSATVETTQSVEEQARREYMRALQVFTDMIVRGKMPEDETIE